MILIDGKKIAADLREELKKEVINLKSNKQGSWTYRNLNWRYGTKPNICSYERKSSK